MKNEILSNITTECPWRDTLLWYDTVDSTNTRAKELAKAGAPAGTLLVADAQTQGRGRLGRSFSSPEGTGVYLSVILRPNCPPDALMHLTCVTAVAACRAVERAAGFVPQIKWANDLVWQQKKLGGILTELGLGAKGNVDYAIIGIGINCNQLVPDFPPELQAMATSIRQITGLPCPPAKLAAALTEELYRLNRQLLADKAELMDNYRTLCITPGREISVIRGDEKYYAKALSVDDEGGLVILSPDGKISTVTSGEVSVRGMYGYL